MTFTNDEIAAAIESDHLGECTDAVAALLGRALDHEPDYAHALCVTAAQYEAMASVALKHRAGKWVHYHDVGAEWMPKNHDDDDTVTDAELAALQHLEARRP